MRTTLPAGGAGGREEARRARAARLRLKRSSRIATTLFFPSTSSSIGCERLKRLEGRAVSGDRIDFLVDPGQQKARENRKCHRETHADARCRVPASVCTSSEPPRATATRVGERCRTRHRVPEISVTFSAVENPGREMIEDELLLGQLGGAFLDEAEFHRAVAARGPDRFLGRRLLRRIEHSSRDHRSAVRISVAIRGSSPAFSRSSGRLDTVIEASSAAGEAQARPSRPTWSDRARWPTPFNLEFDFFTERTRPCRATTRGKALEHPATPEPLRLVMISFWRLARNLGKPAVSPRAATRRRCARRIF